jgi:hypothetical protein
MAAAGPKIHDKPRNSAPATCVDAMTVGCHHACSQV